MRHLRLLFLLLMTSGTLVAQPELKEIKKLYYTGYYNWGVVWVKAGFVEFKVSRSTKYPNAVELFATGQSIPSRDWIFKVRDTLVSHYNPDNYLPYEFIRKAHEGKYHKTFDYTFDYPNNKVHATIHKIDRYKRLDTIQLQPETFDMLSVAWKARTLDFGSFKVDDKIPIRILLDNDIFNLYIRYLGTDTIRINRKKYDCYVFSPLLVKGDVFVGGETMKVWISMDENRIPMMVESKILVGSVKGIIDPDKIELYDAPLYKKED
ncbi:MAG: DUF3108 domain-containing protein [Marinifilaceae bacterium]